jgi:hypothetical protein
MIGEVNGELTKSMAAMSRSFIMECMAAIERTLVGLPDARKGRKK